MAHIENGAKKSDEELDEEAEKRWNDESVDRRAGSDEREAESPDEPSGEGADQDQPGAVVPHAVPSDSPGG
ncbi:MAG TPA: hypothetical protein VMU99_05890 [Acidimicrobiales bacterium]|nr:hypothetical protein [Acidimicrobiales bacterium]